MRFSVAANRTGTAAQGRRFPEEQIEILAQRATMRTDKLPGDTDQASGIFMLGLVLGASVPLFFLALG